MSAAALLPQLAGCSSAPSPADVMARPDAKIRDRLSTNIAADGLKLFTYTVMTGNDSSMAEEAVNAPLRQSRQQQGRSPGRAVAMQPDLTEWTEQIELGLARTLEMSGYCREGSVELSRLIERDRAEIRGECNEGATEEDRRRFANPG
ncbi:hypothetical protein KJI95_14750 [Shewanella sp. JM162201]|uniref:Lipoprotein n=2 Tax=Shewanella jiangmenensis TaxID=2837387 RepID=A0ABS5V5Q3_9GAMM|nr:hypothetical protein [Shewanella jiangmenensis]MBT1445770.1 hypothetical protein [Shewanella jiangmenensis]